jgi:hypothetical protein
MTNDARVRARLCLWGVCLRPYMRVRVTMCVYIHTFVCVSRGVLARHRERAREREHSLTHTDTHTLSHRERERVRERASQRERERDRYRDSERERDKEVLARLTEDPVPSPVIQLHNNIALSLSLSLSLSVCSRRGPR